MPDDANGVVRPYRSATLMSTFPDGYHPSENFPTRREAAGAQQLAALSVTTVRAPRLDREACGRLADSCDAAAARRELAGHLLGAALLWRISNRKVSRNVTDHFGPSRNVLPTK